MSSSISKSLNATALTEYVQIIAALNTNIYTQPITTAQLGNNLLLNYVIPEKTLRETGIWYLSPVNPKYQLLSFYNVSIQAADNSVPYYNFATQLSGLLRSAEKDASLANLNAFQIKLNLADYDYETGMTGIQKVLSITLEISNYFS